MSDSAVRWHSIHVHHHDGSAESALVRHAVRPAFEAVRGSVGGAWFGRHWRRGPHLRLNFLTSDWSWDAEVRPTVIALVSEYLRAHPSTAGPDEAALAPVHQRLAELEMETGPLHPWLPDNVVLEQPYDHRLQVLGSMRASELLAGFLSDTTDLVFRMYDHLSSGGALPTLALDLMWTTTAVAAIPFEAGGAPIERGILSLRSHADAFLSRTRDPTGYRATFDERYRRQADALSRRLRAVESALAGGGGEPPFVREWGEVVRRYQRIAYPLLASGEVSLRGAGRAPRMPTQQVSEFHQLLQSGHGHADFLWSDHWFASFRLVVNYLYVHLGRLGLGPADRGLLCHLAANTVESLHGVSATGSFQRYVVSGSAAGPPEWVRLGAQWADGMA